MPHTNGMGWIRLEKRMAIYHRDRFDCTWCRSVFPLDIKGYGLTLDHLSRDESDHSEQNLVTACMRCNSRRERADLDSWLSLLSSEGMCRRSLRERIARLTQKRLDKQAGIYLATLRRPNYRLQPVRVVPRVLEDFTLEAG